MGDGGPIALPADHGDGGAHPLKSGRSAMMWRIRAGPSSTASASWVSTSSLSAIGSLARMADRRTGQFACHVPAHAVGDDEQVVAGVAESSLPWRIESHVAARRVAEDEGHGLLPQLDDGLSHPQ